MGFVLASNSFLDHISFKATDVGVFLMIEGHPKRPHLGFMPSSGGSMKWRKEIPVFIGFLIVMLAVLVLMTYLPYFIYKA